MHMGAQTHVQNTHMHKIKVNKYVSLRKDVWKVTASTSIGSVSKDAEQVS